MADAGVLIPADSAGDRLARAMVSLEGLSCGDAFGEMFFLPQQEARALIASRTAPAGPWAFTDDTMMAISIVETLRLHGEIVEPRLAGHFARLYDPERGYGPAMDGLLVRLATRGEAFWREEAGALFGGQGSLGNGSAMRVAPLGAYFADDLSRVVEQAERSAGVTHAHPEAAAGAIAVAVGAAVAWRSGLAEQAMTPVEYLDEVRSLVPASAVRRGMERALELEVDATVEDAVGLLGNGARGSAADTVPFALWSAAQSLGDFEKAMWRTVSGLGDRDTTCAMVGGMVAMRTGLAGIPTEWRRRREALANWMESGEAPS